MSKSDRQTDRDRRGSWTADYEMTINRGFRLAFAAFLIMALIYMAAERLISGDAALAAVLGVAGTAGSYTAGKRVERNLYRDPNDSRRSGGGSGSGGR